MTKNWRIEIRKKFDLYDKELARKITEYLGISIYNIEKIDVYRFTTPSDVSLEEIRSVAYRVFSDPVIHKMTLHDSEDTLFDNEAIFIDIHYFPGVTDNIAKTAMEALCLLKHKKWIVYTGKLFIVFGKNLTSQNIQKMSHQILMNPLLESIEYYHDKSFLEWDRFNNVQVPKVVLNASTTIKTIPIFDSIKQLMLLNEQNFWAFNTEELKTIQSFFQQPDIQKMRQHHNLPALPTDVEIEVIAQTWSEHCKHKIFAANISYEEKNIPPHMKLFQPIKISSLFQSYIKGITQKLSDDGHVPWLVSVFSDNAGIVRFDKSIDICVKVETHNSPSALDPYGGSLTGILGVNRDVLACGLGAKPIANIDVFCLGFPNMELSYLPKDLKHPREILEGVHLGVEHGGNKSGIPTVNGSMLFHPDYTGKPLVYVGTIGVLPQTLPDGRKTHKKKPCSGDRIMVVGGAVGKDGIHGATFSSTELTNQPPASVVQIGDSITQKRVSDFMLAAREEGLYSCLTDNGAGGLSSSIGEMAELCGGASFDLKKCPLKYPGLKPYEIMISESQERLTFSVPKEKVKKFQILAKKYQIHCSNLGEFHEEGYLKVFYGDSIVALLDLNFLHHGVPTMQLQACWEGPRDRQPWYPEPTKTTLDFKGDHLQQQNVILKKILSSFNVRSKEDWVRRYDQEVQGATILKPFTGSTQMGPSNSGVLSLSIHGGEEETAVSIAHGLAPKLSQYDPYLMACYSVDEAVRNVISCGADPDHVALVDNFCWPDPIASKKTPDGAHKLGQLVRSCLGLYDIALCYRMPFISGKDSMKNDFMGQISPHRQGKISVLPTLLITAIAKVPDKTKIISTELSAPNKLLYMIGPRERGLAYSVFSDFFSLQGSTLEKPVPCHISENRHLYYLLYQLIQKELILSCHDISEGGLLTTLSEASIGSSYGMELSFSEEYKAPWDFLNFVYNEGPGRFVVSIHPKNKLIFEQYFSQEQFLYLGFSTKKSSFIIKIGDLFWIKTSVENLKKTWKPPDGENF